MSIFLVMVGAVLAFLIFCAGLVVGWIVGAFWDGLTMHERTMSDEEWADSVVREAGEIVRRARWIE